MHRTEGSNYNEIAGKKYFTNSPPGTTVEQNWLNAVQEEVAGVIEAEGITLQSAATETRDQLNTALDLKAANSLATTPYADFESKDLLIDVATDTTVTMTAKRLSFLNSSFYAIFESDVDETFDATTDTVGGLALKASTWYWLWRDSAGVRRLAPDLTGTDTGADDSKLIDAAADFVTDLVQAGDIVYNTTDGTSATVSAVDDLNTLSLTPIDPTFVMQNGDSYIVRMLSPVGLGAYRSRVGAAYSNVSADFDDSFYTQIQEEKFYSQAAGDFTVSGTNWTTATSYIGVRQANSWTGIGSWVISGRIAGLLSSTITISFTGTITGFLTFAKEQAVYTSCGNGSYNGVATDRNYLPASSNRFILRPAAATPIDQISINFEANLDKKPDFHK